MLKKIKQITSVLVAMFLFILLLITILSIWDLVSNEIAKEALIKISYTFGAIYIVSLMVMFITNRTKNEK